MAIPVMTDIYQAQWAFQAPSGLPEDQFVNTWYFRNDGVGATPAEVGATIETVLAAAYGTMVGLASKRLADWMPGGLPSAVIKVYDLGEQLPRYPVHEADTGVSPNGNLSELPREVAVCLSYYSGRGPRKRGRVYIGPLTTSAVDSSGDVPRVDGQLRTDLLEVALNVLNTSENVTWMQVSTTYGVASPVTGGWIDNAFDTQRRRGKAPDTRTTWGAPAT